ncbi:LytS/YhcK type 5TM receptor domain-containing protein [Roseovarius arcticus]|uniref:LytS/YhcK type 5TM receptor domain-containing protein n=1 Tax=Roseovarius arcticus TaxID=2547404 RepID=UPI001110EAD0|nr:LytS/YhcK type 5TM receptor domain-containing protein [Roseovarius arcticus]
MLLLPEIIGSLAVVALLASAFGAIRSWLHDARAQLALGLAFGLVAMFQMNAPIEMVPGVILDMRNVPVALAGAFLGWRGALVCVAIAAATRFTIGGVGMPSGIAAMMIACGAGYLWNYYTMRAKRRGIVQLMVLAALVSSHMIAAFLLPWEVCIAFFATAALPMAGLNMLSIPIAAAFLEHERLRMLAERALATDLTFDPISGLANFEQFKRDALALARSDCNGRVTGLLVVRTLGARRLAKDLGRDAFREVQSAMRLRLQEFDATEVAIAVTNDGRIVMSLDFRQVAEPERIMTEVRRVLNDHAYHLKDDPSLRISVSVDVHAAPTPGKLEAALDGLSISSSHATVGTQRSKSVITSANTDTPQATRRPQQERLFAAASVLFATKDTG